MAGKGGEGGLTAPDKDLLSQLELLFGSAVVKHLQTAQLSSAQQAHTPTPHLVHLTALDETIRLHLLEQRCTQRTCTTEGRQSREGPPGRLT